MDIIISANEAILELLTSSKSRITEDLSREEFVQRVYKAVQTGAEDGTEVQEVPI